MIKAKHTKSNDGLVQVQGIAAKERCAPLTQQHCTESRFINPLQRGRNIERPDMAKIIPWSGNSPHAREVAALERLNAELPAQWFGYANVFVKDPQKDTGQEVDLILVCDDRILMIDLKDWVGSVTQGRGVWYQTKPGRPPESMGADPIQKLFHANNALRNRMKAAGITPQPYVMSAVIFYRSSTDISDVARHANEGGKGRVVSLDAFIAASKVPKRLDALIGEPEFNSRPRGLTEKSGSLFRPLRNFFTVGRDFAVAETTYAGYRAKDEAVSSARLWKHHEASSEDAHGDLALVRLWNFGAEEGLSIDDADRTALVGREDKVQAFLRLHNTGRSAPILAFKQNFNGGARRWELFQNHPDNVTLERFLTRGTEDVPSTVRLDLLESLMGAGAALASAMVAHRDIGEHSIWIDLERRQISLSNLVAARVPETTTAGRNLPKLACGGIADPESLEARENEVDPFRSDVHAFAFAGLKILLGPLTREQLDDSVPIYAISEAAKLEAGIGPALDKWFETALAPDKVVRYATCADAHLELVAALGKDRDVQPVDLLAPYRRQAPCMQDHQQNEMIASSRPGVMEWRTIRGTGSTSRARLWLMQPTGREKSFLDFLRRGAALSILPPSVAPRIFECSLDAYGPFLCVEEVSGTRLSDSAEALSKLDDESFVRLARRLARAVLTAHEVSLAHGDLSSSNIIIESWDFIDDVELEPRLCMIDWLDFSTEEAGPRETIAYGGDEADPFLRDRRALSRIILEMADSCKPASSVIDAARAFEAEEAYNDLPHWREISLSDIDAFLTHSDHDDTERVLVAIDGLGDGEELTAEDGGYRVLFQDGYENAGKTGVPRATLVGAGVAAVVEFDRNSRTPRKAYKKVVSAGLNAAAARYGLHVQARLLAKPSTGLDGWQFLQTLPGYEKLFLAPEVNSEVRRRPILSIPSRTSATIGSEPSADNVYKADNALHDYRPIPKPLKMWDAALTAEAETWPSATALSKPEPVGGRTGVYRIDVDFDIDPSRLEEGMIVYVKDRSSGKLDKARSSEGSIIIFSDRGMPSIRKDDRLEFRSMGEVSNIRRRAAALDKIAVSPQIPSLPDYFAADAPASLGSIATVRPAAADYGLNEPQALALDHLWRRGPVSFLQGPPGTGKTKFIAAFVHHALSVGGARNVLLTAQTHEAVDGAATRVLELFRARGETIDLIRIASNADKVDAALKGAHAVALQERVREKFSAERAERVAVLAKSLGISAEYVRECAKLLKGVVATAESLVALRAAGPEADATLLDSMRAAFERQCETLNMSPETLADPRLLRQRVLASAAERYDVRRQDAAGLVLKLFDAASEYEEALGRRGALEPVFVRTKRLVCGTCVGLGDERLGLTKEAFDLVVIDEAARAQGSEIAITISTARKVLLVGDQKQLEPFLNPEATRRAADVLRVDESELTKSDFARGFESPYGKTASALLDIQYRMAPNIGKLVSDVFYEGKLKTGRKAPESEWGELPWPYDAELSWVDVAGAETASSGRVRNEAEVEDVVESLERLAGSEAGCKLLAAHEASKLSEAFVGVIAMYADQAAAIRRRIASSSLDRRWREQIKIGTVDSYQGKENPIVLVSLVRDNAKGAIGFLRKENRINVALSRAKERLVIFGARRMFSNSDSKLLQVLSHPVFDERIAPLMKARIAAE